jgi:CDP-diacylglycerol--glycerol-3-phosphate 3-phosphatidyltransferase
MMVGMANPVHEQPATVWNVPNQLTASRLVLSVVLFVLLAIGFYKSAILVFVLAAATDAADGYWARRYGQITQLGRILDPFADKFFICGAFIFLAAVDKSEVKAWMAVVVVGRELLVTALRSFVEERGGDFSAKTAGKWKMVLQSAAVIASLVRLSYLDASGTEWTQFPPEWMTWTVLALVWAAVALTIYSGIEYVLAAVRLVRTL